VNVKWQPWVVKCDSGWPKVILSGQGQLQVGKGQLQIRQRKIASGEKSTYG